MFFWFQKVVRTFVCSWSRQWPWLFQLIFESTVKLSQEQTRPTNWGKTISDLYPYLISDHSSQEKYVSMKSLSDSSLNVMEKLPSLRSKSAELSIKFPSNSNAEVSYMLCQTWIKGRSLLSCTLAAGIGTPGHLYLEELGWESYMQTPPSYSWLVEGLLTTLVSSRWRIKPAKSLGLHSLP